MKQFILCILVGENPLVGDHLDFVQVEVEILFSLGTHVDLLDDSPRLGVNDANPTSAIADVEVAPAVVGETPTLMQGRGQIFQDRFDFREVIAVQI